MESFRSKIRSLREEQSLTQKELADRLKIPASTLGSYGQDRSEPDMNMLKEIAKFYRVSSDYLLNLQTEDSELESSERHTLNSNYDRLNSDGKSQLVLQSNVLVAPSMYLKKLD